MTLTRGDLLEGLCNRGWLNSSVTERAGHQMWGKQGKVLTPPHQKKKKKEENAPERNYSGLSESVVAQSCLTLCNPMDCSLPGSSTHGIFQARILEWVANSFSRGTSQPRDWTLVSSTTGRLFIVWATREVLRNTNQVSLVHILKNPREEFCWFS